MQTSHRHPAAACGPTGQPGVPRQWNHLLAQGCRCQLAWAGGRSSPASARIVAPLPSARVPTLTLNRSHLCSLLTWPTSGNDRRPTQAPVTSRSPPIQPCSPAQGPWQSSLPRPVSNSTPPTPCALAELDTEAGPSHRGTRRMDACRPLSVGGSIGDQGQWPGLRGGPGTLVQEMGRDLRPATEAQGWWPRGRGGLRFWGGQPLCQPLDLGPVDSSNVEGGG